MFRAVVNRTHPYDDGSRISAPYSAPQTALWVHVSCKVARQTAGIVQVSCKCSAVLHQSVCTLAHACALKTPPGTPVNTSGTRPRCPSPGQGPCASHPGHAQKLPDPRRRQASPGQSLRPAYPAGCQSRGSGRALRQGVHCAACVRRRARAGAGGPVLLPERPCPRWSRPERQPCRAHSEQQQGH